MGMFDRVIVPCPHCNEMNEIQSKAGNCTLATYTLKSAPLELLADLSQKSIKCEHCGMSFGIRLHYTAFVERDMFFRDTEDNDEDD